MCFLDKYYEYSEKSTKRFFVQLRGHKGTQEMLRVNRRHTVWVVFQMMRVVIDNRKRQKHLKKIAVHLKSTLADRPHP